MCASVILPTYNGEKKIGIALEALCKQSFTNFETIVVLDGSTDDSISVVKRYKNRLSNLIIVTQDNGGRSIARNKGASIAKTSLLIFIDDDIEVMPDNIESHVRFHEKNPEAILVGSPVLGFNHIPTDAFQSFRYRVELAFLEHAPVGTRKITFNNYVFTTQNVSISEKLFTEIGRFDERLTDSEDFDLSIRLLLANKAIFIDPTLKCWHHDFADIQQTIKRQTQYYLSKKKLLEFHPEYKNLMPAQFAWMQKTKKDQLKKVIFGNRFLWESLIGTSLFSIMPRQLQNAVFSSFIYVHSVMKIKR
ncbi:hypothetical protein WSM22_13490 [Cytophagales bacterium WSM2-2]|nr:hypothetical protein WSM22_13490 [Cytophagales bacterium WSM2-2]